MLAPKDHPVWPIIRTAVVLLALTIILWMNASHFDDTEIRTLVGMFFALLGAEGITNAVSKVRVSTGSDSSGTPPK